MSPARPVVAVSACLLGEQVRYDGGDKRNEHILGTLADYFEYLPFCPEVGIGLPVPRPPLQLLSSSEGVRVAGVVDRSVDVTDALRAYGEEMVSQLSTVCGVIFKSRSPSCGLNTAALYAQDGAVIGNTSGAFASVVAAVLPDIPMTEEEGLCSSQERDRFLHSVLSCNHSKQR